MSLVMPLKHGRPKKIVEKFCYCGKNGELYWYKKMLQCARCKTWFHLKCIDENLQFPLFFGDRFYVFICLDCNENTTEFIRRIEMNINEIVHLLLFNLTLLHKRLYFHETNIIVPYAIDNWPLLQLPKHLSELSAIEIKELILETLHSNEIPFNVHNVRINGIKTYEYGVQLEIHNCLPFVREISLPLKIHGRPIEHFIREYVYIRCGYNLLPKSNFSTKNNQNIFDTMYGTKYIDINTSKSIGESLNFALINSFTLAVNNNRVKSEIDKNCSSQNDCAGKTAITVNSNFLNDLIPGPKNFLGKNNPFACYIKLKRFNDKNSDMNCNSRLVPYIKLQRFDKNYKILQNPGYVTISHMKRKMSFKSNENVVKRRRTCF